MEASQPVRGGRVRVERKLEVLLLWYMEWCGPLSVFFFVSSRLNIGKKELILLEGFGQVGQRRDQDQDIVRP